MYALSSQASQTALDALAEALQARDAYTASHGRRVAELSVRIGERLGIARSEIHTLRVGGRLHDLGKLGIPDAILLKPSALTEQENRIMQMHTRIGRRILSSLRGADELLAAVELHHENFDGSGYPYGLQGDHIPMISRIVRVADAFDAMSTNRVYRPAFTVELAAGQIRDGAGHLFDPDVIGAFESVLRGDDDALASAGLAAQFA